MKRWVKAFILSFCLLALKSDAFIYEIYVMYKVDPADKENKKKRKYFIGLGDFHDKKDYSNVVQMTKLNAIIARRPKDDTQFIVEDISSKGFGDKMACGRFYVNSRGGILGGLAKKYIGKGFTNFKNIEYRFCRVASLSPLLNNVYSGKASFPSSSSIKICCLKNEIAKLLLDINKYNDGDILNKWYKQRIASVFKCMKVFKFSKYKQLSVEDYVNQYTNHINKAKRLNFIKKMLVFDSSLIDIQIVHEMVKSPHRKKVVLAGGSHIRSVAKMLEKIGYTLDYKNSVSFKDEYDMKKCLGCHINPGGFCRKPKPVKLDVLDKYL